MRKERKRVRVMENRRGKETKRDGEAERDDRGSRKKEEVNNDVTIRNVFFHTLKRSKPIFFPSDNFNSKLSLVLT